MEQKRADTKIDNLLLKAKELCKHDGLSSNAIERLLKTVGLNPLMAFRFNRRFYRYFHHEYNATQVNERRVEIPIIRHIIEHSHGKNILEVGNVLGHYFDFPHDVVDKYELEQNVINEDIAEFKPSKKYELIVSISTLEHVGWDEEPRTPEKIFDAVKNMMGCLSAGGRMAVTLPLGYNTEMDKYIEHGKLQFPKQYYMKRVSADNEWLQVNLEDVKSARYDYPYPYANALLVGIVD